MLFGVPDENNGKSHAAPVSHHSGAYKSYRAGDSMVYHQSMFLKRLSNPYMQNDPKHAPGWRHKLGHFLESRKVQIFIFALIVVDLLVICSQLFVIEPQTCDTDEFPLQYGAHSSSAHHSSEHHDSHSEERRHKYEVAGEVMDIISISILCTLGLESLLLIVAFDIKFFKQPLYIVDALVIGITLFIELGVHQGGFKQLQEFGSLLIFFRLWRIVRIVHGVAMSVQEKNEKVIKELEAEVDEVNKHKTELQTKYDYLKKRYRKLVAEQEGNMNAESDLQNDNNENSPTPPSFTTPFASPGAPHTPQTRIKNREPSLRVHDDLSDDDESPKSGTSVSVKTDERTIVINDDLATRQPLVGKTPKGGNEYNTFGR